MMKNSEKFTDDDRLAVLIFCALRLAWVDFGVTYERPAAYIYLFAAMCRAAWRAPNGFKAAVGEAGKSSSFAFIQRAKERQLIRELKNGEFTIMSFGFEKMLRQAQLNLSDVMWFGFLLAARLEASEEADAQRRKGH